jgi:hypothetical protein
MTIDEAINQMLTCAPSVGCQNESACFLVARTLQKARQYEVVSNEPDPAFIVKKPEPVPELEIPHYAPQWEFHTNVIPYDPELLVDWSAA